MNFLKFSFALGSHTIRTQTPNVIPRTQSTALISHPVQSWTHQSIITNNRPRTATRMAVPFMQLRPLQKNSV